MKETPEYIDALLGKYLAGESSPEENAQVQAWLEESEANAKYLEDFRVLFAESAQVKHLPVFDADRAWHRMSQKIRNEARVIPLWGNPWFRYASIAASLVLLITLAYVLQKGNSSTLVETYQVSAQEKVRTDTLPDGSFAVANKHTQIAYSYNPKEKVRVVNLKGEAFFEVADNKEQTFRIAAEDLLIEDIGTAFNVKAYPEQPFVEVYVESGEVRLYTTEKEGIHLLAGETGRYYKAESRFEKLDESPENVLAYKTGTFNFSNTELWFIVETINETYSPKLALANDSIANCKMTVQFHNQDIQSIAEIIAATFSFTLTTTEHEIILDGKSCAQ
ncbi:FecR domain-containing protein [Cytophagales bacterium LB-30]|uniref:FecR domain-containing protein n=1 Tax=Shiella aurantiaca TaxID=3058365 RepID=A0ABT8F1G3_9BACT|nr:FecR domain-containing protein [Shiella aurantiaca]MDN4164194.1 FecR domain-containing protein [Shiella aurantiaca]